MGTPALVIIRFGQTKVNFRRHSDGGPEVTGLHLLELLESAQELCPRAHMHTGSYFLHLVFDAGFREAPLGGISVSKMTDDLYALPFYEAMALDEQDTRTAEGRQILQDWEYAYEFCATPVGPRARNGFVERQDAWQVSFVDGCMGEPWVDLVGHSQKFSAAEFREFVENLGDDEEAEIG